MICDGRTLDFLEIGMVVGVGGFEGWICEWLAGTGFWEEISRLSQMGASLTQKAILHSWFGTRYPT